MSSKNNPITPTDFDKECDLFLEWLSFSIAHKYLRAHRILNRKVDRLIRNNNGDYSWNPSRDINWVEQDELYQNHINQVYSYTYWRYHKEMFKSWADRLKFMEPGLFGNAIITGTSGGGEEFDAFTKMFYEPQSYGIEPFDEEERKTCLYRYFQPSVEDNKLFEKYLFEPAKVDPKHTISEYNYERELMLMQQAKIPPFLEKANNLHYYEGIEFRDPMVVMRRQPPYTLEETMARYPQHFQEGMIFPAHWPKGLVTVYNDMPIPITTKMQMLAFAVIYLPIIVYIIYALIVV